MWCLGHFGAILGCLEEINASWQTQNTFNLLESHFLVLLQVSLSATLPEVQHPQRPRGR